MTKKANLEENARLFKALGDETRLKILQWLMAEKCCKCICNLADYVKKDQSTVFRHIEILRNAGVIKTKKDKKYLWCEINNKQLIEKVMKR